MSNVYYRKFTEEDISRNEMCCFFNNDKVAYYNWIMEVKGKYFWIKKLNL